MVYECICQSNMAFSKMYHNHIDLEYYLNTVVMASWFTVLCANGTTTAPSTRWYFQRIFQKLEISSMTLLSRHGVWSVGWGERRMWQRRMWFCWPVTCALHWQSTELIYSISCCIQHTHTILKVQTFFQDTSPPSPFHNGTIVKSWQREYI